ncbi:receptor-type tyrosine-protein phosphatase alpha-like isoform X2 [Mizuhopecten yessoensis]|uniref:receptor-type tyrosine-protein phosphatase alpha-like isoform X2 n=1 Tax=Mizuhopecten yessoensis TaxID=6573 RepID=UPI000B45C062|nr:receptor-type tyrosine-protein phosphatase alpha-like isoform X2 [Mizuhopecten yessoensis]
MVDLTPRITTCTGITRYLTIYVDRQTKTYSWYSTKAILELCEVQVYGCPLGKYGDNNCDSNCDTTCVYSLCHPNSGQCTYCAPGSYKFGLVCTACPTNCLNDVCNVESGVCSACVDGYHGSQCDQSCPDNCQDKICDQYSRVCAYCLVGFHGNMCNQPCPGNCNNNTCSQENGFCITGCDSGYHGNMCQQPCPINCKDNMCSQDTGICDGCDSGYHGNMCNQTCPANCKNNTCSQDNGTCNTGCDSGYHGNMCQQPCPINCKDNMCSQDTGICEECIPGSYTTECNQPCPNNCKDSICDRNSGECSACTNGYYGLKCKEKCGQCIGVSCGMTNGTCKCSDGWEGETCLSQKAMVSAPEVKTATIAGGVVGAVAVIALVVIATFIILKRKKISSNKESPRENNAKPFDKLNSSSTKLKRQNTYDQPFAMNEDGLDYVNMHDIDIDTENDAVYTNIGNADAVVSSVSIHELRYIIDRKMVDKAAAFQEEFKAFPLGAVHPHEAGKKASNKSKNRFKTTFPYDHSRIILETIGNDIDTSYTNANYLDSVQATKQYIASQGPKPNTLDDFWRMVWQVSAGKIVMLTNIMEGGIVKCHKYWPDEGEPLSTPTFQLKLDKERTYAFYVIRDISIVKKKTKEERLVQQFHFTTWPDHGTPDTLELVLFHRRVTSFETQLTGQMVVHCSAGLGRTGTFIGLDALLSYGKKTGQVDIPRYVKTMRKDRMNMIQNYEQYIALHELLVEGFNLQESHILRMNFPAVLAAKCPKNKPANQTKIHQEFKALQTFNPSYTPSSYKAALLKVNEDKNRSMDILAVDKFRAFLQSQPSNRTDYINAILIQSHTSKSGYLMTQFPLKDTVDDFWTMVCDYSCENIVVLGQPSEECWLGENDSTTSAAFSFRTVDERFTSDDLTILDYQVTGESNSSEATVRIFTMKQWSSESLSPPSDSSLLLLLEQLDSRRRSDNTKPVIVMCRDGCTQSGLFCCISNIRDQMKMDDDVDIFQTARQLKKRRPEALKDVKQYQYCYKILGQYLDSTDVYVN